MRRLRETMIWGFVLVVVVGAIYLASAPEDIETIALVQMCHKPGKAEGCRLCGGKAAHLPYVLDEHSVRIDKAPFDAGLAVNSEP